MSDPLIPESSEPIPAEPLPPPPMAPKQPGVWPAFVAGVCGLVGGAILGGIALVVYAVVTHGPEILNNQRAMKRALAAITASPEGMMAVALPTEIALILVALAAALLSKGRWTEQLGFCRTRCTARMSACCVLATPIFAAIGGLSLQLIYGAPSSQMKALEEMAKGTAEEFAWLSVIVIGMVAPFAEETLFRGYVQRRLLTRWRPWSAIAVSTIFFVLAHGDPAHMLTVLPLGVWLGFVAWQAGSIWPSILCHAAQNTLFVMYRQPGAAGDFSRVAVLVLVPIALVALAGVIVELRRKRRVALAGEW